MAPHGRLLTAPGNSVHAETSNSSQLLELDLLAARTPQVGCCCFSLHAVRFLVRIVGAAHSITVIRVDMAIAHQLNVSPKVKL